MTLNIIKIMGDKVIPGHVEPPKAKETHKKKRLRATLLSALEKLVVPHI